MTSNGRRFQLQLHYGHLFIILVMIGWSYESSSWTPKKDQNWSKSLIKTIINKAIYGWKPKQYNKIFYWTRRDRDHNYSKIHKFFVCFRLFLAFIWMVSFPINDRTRLWWWPSNRGCGVAQCNKKNVRYTTESIP